MLKLFQIVGNLIMLHPCLIYWYSWNFLGPNLKARATVSIVDTTVFWCRGTPNMMMPSKCKGSNIFVYTTVQARSQLWGHWASVHFSFSKIKCVLWMTNFLFTTPHLIVCMTCIIQFRQFDRMFSVRGMKRIFARRCRSERGLRE